jgi:hypothetical protein
MPLPPLSPSQQAAADQKDAWAKEMVDDLVQYIRQVPEEQRDIASLAYLFFRAVESCPWHNGSKEDDLNVAVLLALEAIRLLVTH